MGVVVRGPVTSRLAEVTGEGGRKRSAFARGGYGGEKAEWSWPRSPVGLWAETGPRAPALAAPVGSSSGRAGAGRPSPQRPSMRGHPG